MLPWAVMGKAYRMAGSLAQHQLSARWSMPSCWPPLSRGRTG
jgi:hypothetical protein